MAKPKDEKLTSLERAILSSIARGEDTLAAIRRNIKIDPDELASAISELISEGLIRQKLTAFSERLVLTSTGFNAADIGNEPTIKQETTAPAPAKDYQRLRHEIGVGSGIAWGFGTATGNWLFKNLIWIILVILALIFLFTSPALVVLIVILVGIYLAHKWKKK